MRRQRGVSCISAALTLISRDQLRENALLQKYYLDININDLISFNEDLAHRLVSEPAEIIPLVCAPLIQYTRSTTLISV